MVRNNVNVVQDRIKSGPCVFWNRINNYNDSRTSQYIQKNYTLEIRKIFSLIQCWLGPFIRFTFISVFCNTMSGTR